MKALCPVHMIWFDYTCPSCDPPRLAIAPREFKIGGMWEYSNWAVEFNYDVMIDSEVTPCPHCINTRDVHKARLDGTTFTIRFTTCPRVVVAKNEGGCNTTGVCLDCLLKAVKDLQP